MTQTESLNMTASQNALIIEEFEVAIKNIARNANSKIVLFKLCIKLTKLLKLKSKFVEE